MRPALYHRRKWNRPEAQSQICKGAQCDDRGDSIGDKKVPVIVEQAHSANRGSKRSVAGTEYRSILNGIKRQGVCTQRNMKQ